MNISIGETVRFLTEKLEGKVTGITDRNTVQVFVEEYGFEIPASIHDLVVIRSDFTQPEASSKAETERRPNQQSISTESADTLYLAIVPDNFNNLTDARYELFIVNDTDRICLYSVAFRQNDKYTGILAGNCNPDSASSIGSYTLKEIDSDIKAVSLQAIFFQKGVTRLKNAIETELKINPVNLCKTGSYKRVRWFDTVALLRPLEQETLSATEEIDGKQLREALKEKQAADTQPVRHPQKQATGNIVEIDLHSNELLETTAGMDNKDILEYQLDVFRKTMDEYKLRKGKKIIFIHGKGDGVLRQRILWELQTKYKRHQHQDASFKQYGYGATMVTIK
ncbi:MAG: DUF2027 domain-containing protein [Odoribacter sp.]|nr:DUF2027 domain-containing protein [Odoribacter sp.]